MCGGIPASKRGERLQEMRHASRSFFRVHNSLIQNRCLRPTRHGDIWLDIFQSHCLVLSMASVTESLVIDYISRWCAAGRLLADLGLQITWGCGLDWHTELPRNIGKS